MYVLQSRMSAIINFLRNTIRSCKFMQLAIFANRYVCTVLTDFAENQYTCTFYEDACLE